MPAVAGFRDVLVNLADSIDMNWHGTIDQLDTEFLHDLRIAVRRTRAVVGQGKSVLPPAIITETRDGFARLGALTAPARDLDVYLIEWNGYVQPLGTDAAVALTPVRSILEQRLAGAHTALEAGLRSQAARDLMATWHSRLDTLADIEPRGPHAERPLGAVVAKRITAAHTRLVEHGRLIRPDTPAEHVHDLRKDAKKLRYLIECFGSILPAAPRKRFVSRLKAFQDNLGEHQDAEVHLVMIREIAGQLHDRRVPADTMLAIGQLSERLERVRIAARAEFAERFAAYDTPRTQRALDVTLEPLGR
jgi:CHAD domain-containing protein